MRKAILISIVLATFWIPMAQARAQNPNRTLRKIRKQFVVFCGLYVIAIVYVLPRL